MTNVKDGHYCRTVAASALEVLVRQARERAVDGHLTVETVEEMARAISQHDSELHGFFTHASGRCRVQDVPRFVLSGQSYLIELHGDGTGLVRERRNGRPIAAMTSVNTTRAEARVREVVDELAEVSIKAPAPWGYPPETKKESTG